jgi:hypothetical protein
MNFLDNESKTPTLFCFFILFEMPFRNCSCPLSFLEIPLRNCSCLLSFLKIPFRSCSCPLNFLESGYACPAFYKAPVPTKAIQNVPKLGSESLPGRMKKLFPS